jgi:hypothetical protein
MFFEPNFRQTFCCFLNEIRFQKQQLGRQILDHCILLAIESLTRTEKEDSW